MMASYTDQRKRIHPHKFTMWVALGSIVMMFAGLTSAYVVKRNQSNWLEFDLPAVFWYSTVAILASSLSIYLASQAFKAREMRRYRLLMSVTVVLGLVFTVLQLVGFSHISDNGIKLIGTNSNPAASFLAVLTGVHIVHVLGGVVALVIMYVRAYTAKQKTYSSVSLEIVSTYWHFVDALWIYLFIFFHVVQV